MTGLRPGADIAPTSSSGTIRLLSPKPSQGSRLAGTIAAGVLIGIGYYLGARVGLALTLRPAPVSTLWPPNAILLAALLLSSPRRWWVLLLAALPAHLLVEVGAGIPWPMVLCWFISNSTEALIGAAGVRRFVPGPLRLDSARQLVVFLLFAVVLAPFLSSFLDAWFVALNRFGEGGYWEVWRQRFFSNVVAALTVAPVIVIAGNQGIRLKSRIPLRVVAEACLVTLALVAACLIVFVWQPAGPQTNPGLLYAPLPFLLWAAVRFGPGGASAALLGFTLIAIGGATRGLGPFTSASPGQNAFAMQEFIILTAVPLLMLSAILQERSRAERTARLSQGRLGLALRAAGLGTWEWISGSGEASWSAETRQFFGRPSAGERVSLRSVLHQVLDQDRPQLRAMLRQRPLHGSLYEVDFRIRRPDRAVRWLRTNAIVLSEGDGVPARLLGVVADITERRESVDALRESEARFRSVFEIGTLPMAFWSADGRITDANDAFLRLVGCTRGAIADGEVWWSRLTAPEFQIRDLTARLGLRVAGQYPPYEKEYLLPDGRRVPVLSAPALLGPDHGISVELDLTELKRVERELEERLQFERLVGELRATFVTARLDQDPWLVPWLARLGGFMGAERVTLFMTSPSDGILRAAFDSTEGEGLASLHPAAFPTLTAMIERDEPVTAASLADLPADPPDQDNLRDRGVAALLATPIFLSGELFGSVVLTRSQPGPWPLLAHSRLRWVGEILVSILARRVAEAEIRSVQALNSAVLTSLPGATVILDRSGIIERVEGRSTIESGEGLAPLDPPYLGRNYLERCRELCEQGDTAAAAVYQAVTAVLSGVEDSALVSYVGRGPGGKLRWHEIRVARLARPQGGAVLLSFDITAQKEAELEAGRHRDNLAHLVRVATLGQLAASFAHELKQPLTAIRANAQAGHRLLASRRFDPAELGEIISDIVRDDARAADILTRTSALLRKEHLELEPLDLNAMVVEVLGLLHGDLVLHGVRHSLELSPFLPVVRGDRVQLQQVILNLVLNGVDALHRNGTGARHLSIRTEAEPGGAVCLAVTDNGPGIPGDKLELVFEAFYTTKSSGLGMGLSIARTILDAHGGRVWATNNPEGGATVSFTLPTDTPLPPPPDRELLAATSPPRP